MLQLLWPALGGVKRTQATNAQVLVARYQADGTRRRRKSRTHAPDLPSPAERCPDDIERAWAAGFLDAEGCFGLNRGRRRVRGSAWYRIRVSADQHGVVGAVPEVLRESAHVDQPVVGYRKARGGGVSAREIRGADSPQRRRDSMRSRASLHTGRGEGRSTASDLQRVCANN